MSAVAFRMKLDRINHFREKMTSLGPALPTLVVLHKYTCKVLLFCSLNRSLHTPFRGIDTGRLLAWWCRNLQAVTPPASGLTRLLVLLWAVVNSAGPAWKHLGQPGVDQSRDCSIGAARLCLSSWWAGGLKPQWEVCVACLWTQTELFEEHPLCLTMPQP